MLNSVYLNRFFNESNRLVIQPTSKDLLSYFYKMYRKNDDYLEFENYINSNFTEEHQFLNYKDSVIYSTLKSIFLTPEYHLFNRYNGKIYGYILYFKLLEHAKLDDFIAIYKKHIDSSLFDNFLIFCEEREKDPLFIEKSTDKKVTEFNSFFKIFEKGNFNMFFALDSDINDFVTDFDNAYDLTFNINIKTAKDIFSTNYANQTVLSVDLKSANFQALRILGIIKNYLTFEDWFKTFSDDIFLIKNKNLRQVIFGNLNASRIQGFENTIIKYLISQIKEKDNSIDIYLRSDDELIILNPKSTDIDIANDCIKDLFKILKTELFFNITNFKIKVIETNYGIFYYKEFEDGKKEIKACNSKFYPQLYKLINNDTIYNEDMVFEDSDTKILSQFKEKMVKVENSILVKRWKRLLWNTVDNGLEFHFKNSDEIALDFNNGYWRISYKIAKPLLEEFKLTELELSEFIKDMLLKNGEDCVKSINYF